MEFNEFAFWLLCGLLAGGVCIFAFFLKGILDEMKAMNGQLIKVITNQEWHFEAIQELREWKKETEPRLQKLEIHMGVELEIQQ